jgi:hypothetical protein
VSLATWGLRHNRSHWVRVEQMTRYDRRAFVEARLADDGRVAAATENVSALSLGPIRDRPQATLAIDGAEVGPLRLDAAVTLRRGPDGTWGRASQGEAGGKRHGVSGPIGDLFHEGTVLVPGTAGSEEETFFNEWVARNASSYFSARNGGVHRGGIMGRNSVELPVVPDGEIGEELLAGRNLILYGTDRSNAVLRRFGGGVPVEFEQGAIRLAGRTYSGPRAAVLAVFPHPLNADRYVAVHGGVTPDAITWGSHLDMMLLPDYIVYSGGEVLDWGFWGSDWTPPA